MTETFLPAARTQVRRLPHRGTYDKSRSTQSTPQAICATWALQLRLPYDALTADAEEKKQEPEVEEPC